MNTQKPLKSKVSITLDEDVIKKIKAIKGVKSVERS